MIHELSGDILLSGAQAIAQGVAPNDDFHHGLALQLRERMPTLYKDFRHVCQTRHPKSGGLWSWLSADGRIIVNLFTQDGAYDHGSKPGRATLSNVNHALHALRVLAEKRHCVVWLCRVWPAVRPVWTGRKCVRSSRSIWAISPCPSMSM